MSHLACADNPDHPLNATQINVFRELHMLYPGIPASLANSSGIFLGNSAHFDLARPGAALYGVNPTPGRPNPMKNVVELTGRILQTPQSSGATRRSAMAPPGRQSAPRASRSSRSAMPTGLLRAGSGTDERPGGAAIIAGKRCPIVGRISMDLICIDVTDACRRRRSSRRPRDADRRGDLRSTKSRPPAGTIGYEILTRLGPRCHLVYRGA